MRRLKTIIVLGVPTAVVGYGALQGQIMRDRFNASRKLQPPQGPNDGIAIHSFDDPLNSRLLEIREKMEKIVSRDGGIQDKLVKETEELKRAIKAETDELMLKVATDLTVIKDNFNWLKHSFSVPRNLSSSKTHSIEGGGGGRDGRQFPTVSKKKRKIKLLVIGDSLVCGVGVEDGAGSVAEKRSPVLPQVLANVLSLLMQADVKWQSRGIVGADIKDIRSNIMPKIVADLSCSLEKDKKGGGDAFEDCELIVVVICGLNDWKGMLENFPNGLGPVKFREELRQLVDDIKHISSHFSTFKSCKVVLVSYYFPYYYFPSSSPFADEISRTAAYDHTFKTHVFFHMHSLTLFFASFYLAGNAT
jgi:lysophospholipase L1-like esterase